MTISDFLLSICNCPKPEPWEAKKKNLNKTTQTNQSYTKTVVYEGRKEEGAMQRWE